MAVPKGKVSRQRRDKRRSSHWKLEPIVQCYREYCAYGKQMADAQELMSDPEFKELAQEEYSDAKQKQGELEEKLLV